MIDTIYYLHHTLWKPHFIILVFSFIYLLVFLFIIFIMKHGIKKLYKQFYDGIPANKMIDYMLKYIKRHPLSIYNSTLRMRIVFLLIMIGDKERLNVNIKKLKLIDIIDPLDEPVILSLFLMKELDFDEGYTALKEKIINKRKIFGNEPIDFLLYSGFDKSVLMKKTNNKNILGIESYYLGVNYRENGDIEKANSCFKNAENLIGDKVFSTFLKKKGYAL